MAGKADKITAGDLTERVSPQDARTEVGRLSRLDQHPERHDEAIDVTGLARECAERARTAYPERTWHARIDPGLMTSGDEELLRRAIDNLLANVAAHTPDDTTATLTAAHHGTATATPNHPHGLVITLTLPASTQPGPVHSGLPWTANPPSTTSGEQQTPHSLRAV
jgi:phage tail protein X